MLITTFHWKLTFFLFGVEAFLLCGYGAQMALCSLVLTSDWYITFFFRLRQWKCAVTVFPIPAPPAKANLFPGIQIVADLKTYKAKTPSEEERSPFYKCLSRLGLLSPQYAIKGLPVTSPQISPTEGGLRRRNRRTMAESIWRNWVGNRDEQEASSRTAIGGNEWKWRNRDLKMKRTSKRCFYCHRKPFT